MNVLKYVFYIGAILIIKISAETGVYLGIIPALALFIFAGRISRAVFGEDPMTPGKNQSIKQMDSTKLPDGHRPKTERAAVSRKTEQSNKSFSSFSTNSSKIENKVYDSEEKDINDKLNLLKQSFNSGLLDKMEFEAKTKKLKVQLNEIQEKNELKRKEQKEAELLNRIRYENREKLNLLKQLRDVGEISQAEFHDKETKLLINEKARYEEQKDLIDPGKFKIVKDGQSFGYANEENEIIIDCRFEDAFPFSEGLACVKLDGKKGFINNKGMVVIDCKFESATFFKEGKSEVVLNNEKFMIDKKGKRL